MPNKPKVTDKLRTSLRQRGFRVTNQRMLILELLERSRTPLSALEIHQQLKMKLDRATVYRVLEVLEATELIRRIDFRHSHAHFELARAHDHHHIVCIKCGFAEDIAGCKIEGIEQSILRKSRRFGKIKEHSLEFFGVCKDCAD